MGDLRYHRSYARLHETRNRVAAIRTISDEEVLEALAGASLERDPLFANFLATEAINRLHRARRVLDHLAEGVVATDRSGNVVLLNPAAERLLGWLHDEASGRPLAEILRAKPPAESEGDLAASAPLELVKSAQRAPVRYPNIVLEGKWPSRLEASLTANPIYLHGEDAGVVIAFQDARAAHEAESLRLQLETLWRGMPDGVIGKTLNGLITSWSPACERIYGYAAAEAIGRSVRDLLLTPEEWEAEQEALDQASRGEVVRERVSRRRRKDGRIVPISVTLLPVRDRGGRVDCLFSIQHPLEQVESQEAADDA